MVGTSEELERFERWLAANAEGDGAAARVARLWHDAGVRWSDPANKRALQEAMRAFFDQDEVQSGRS